MATPREAATRTPFPSSNWLVLGRTLAGGLLFGAVMEVGALVLGAMPAAVTWARALERRRAFPE